MAFPKINSPFSVFCVQFFFYAFIIRIQDDFSIFDKLVAIEQELQLLFDPAQIDSIDNHVTEVEELYLLLVRTIDKHHLSILEKSSFKCPETVIAFLYISFFSSIACRSISASSSVLNPV